MDPLTLSNFSKANPGLTPNSQDISIANGGPSSSGTRSLYDPSSGSDLSSALSSGFNNDPQYQDILSRYNSAAGATGAANLATGNLINTEYGQNIDYQQKQNEGAMQGLKESQRGFATNTALLTYQQDQADQRIKSLTDQQNAALMSNNAEGAKQLSDLATQEQTAITNARTNFLNQYFGSQTEARSEASFQTPEQQSVITLSGQHPDAGILPTDSLAVAQAKVQASPTFKQNLALGNANIAASNASATASLAGAGLSSAQAQYQRSLTGILGQATDPNAQANDVNSLLSGSATPQQVQDKYAQIPGGAAIAQHIISQAQSKGYNLNAGTLTGVAQNAKTQAMNSGNLFSMFGSWVGGALNSGAAALNAPTRTLAPASTGVTPSGVKYTVTQ